MIKQKSAVDKLLADQEIKRYKELLERKLSEPDPYPDNDWARSDGMANYYRKCIKLLELGCEIKPHPQGCWSTTNSLLQKEQTNGKCKAKESGIRIKPFKGLFTHTSTKTVKHKNWLEDHHEPYRPDHHAGDRFWWRLHPWSGNVFGMVLR